MANLNLPALFRRALKDLSKAASLPVVKDETQELVRSARRDLQEVISRVNALSLFSPNESVEDVSTRDLVYLFTPFAAAEAEGRVRMSEPEERIERIIASRGYLQTFVDRLLSYGVIPEAEQKLYGASSTQVQDATRRREMKIKQYKAEKELRAQIEARFSLPIQAIRKRRRQTPVEEDDSSDLNLIASLLPSSSAVPDEDGDDTDDVLRQATLALLRLMYTQAQSQLASLEQELALLRSAPPRPPTVPESSRSDDAKDWRLDIPTAPRDGPLLDPNGKPMRPFTILPAGASDRAEVQSQVFRPDHRLPTMSIDEYLEIERQRGNIITGGGPVSMEQPTTSEQLAIDAEQDGSAFGAQREEEKRQKDENWARYTDANPRGAGNSMNRG
ncbi:hypothetical protein PUNSTDRAFT_70691 [Punctularia strigosozonata HHB-11173 SS5]|uniref:uncharacterized protein n=1 Tax=Punctularia strigosozonata (strain HHB-11173) TaxID=741275 RepID=UPI0004417A90|nr:uncharacterized protein PUNSTDRAFT_70691 [Punctularia strigosozonata HHB-11173 SS5]EIN07061.1 hypothetical protein PUNSTDRAFT_70691 [Punctularia strigosozonata HHB-11173 SS5]